jgi:creatinine amidohydrolase
VVRLYERNWLQVEEYLRHDDRVVVPVGSTEQHAYLSLGTDTILAERVAVEAAEPLGVLVLPAMPFAIAPGFAAFPGTVSLRPETLVAVLTETLETLRGQGFGRFLVVNGHGGNTPAREPVERWGARWHDWWDSPGVRAAAAEIYAGDAAHASWFENFPWTRLPGVELPSEDKPPVTDREALRELDANAVKAAIGDGSYGGPYAVPDEQALAVWAAGVAEVRALIESL